MTLLTCHNTWITPPRAAFLGSLILSLIAVCTSPAINRDGMLYVDTARAFLNGGFSAANGIFNWPFLPILMALVSKSTGLGLEGSGYLLNALFLAGTCSLIVDCAKRNFFEATWSICLVVLALPGLNHYRDEILREYGCWFFFTLSFWLAVRWSETPSIKLALALQLALVIAALFRPEALVFFPTLAIWQLFSAPEGQKWRRTVMIFGLPLTGIAILIALLLSGQLETGRLSGEFGRINFSRFDQKAKILASALIPYARDQAKTILFLGSIAIIPLKFIKQLSIFVVPLLFVFSKISYRTVFSRFQPFAWAFIAHLLVLAVFVLDMQFLAGRYVIVLQLLAAPIIGYGFWLLMQKFPRWKHAMVLLALAIMINNVVSFSPKKTQFMEAGAWLASNAKESPRVYVESSMVTHYARWRLLREAPSKDRSQLAEAVLQNKYDLLVLENTQNESDIRPWIATIGLRVIQHFGRPGGTEIFIAEPSFPRTHDN